MSGEGLRNAGPKIVASRPGEDWRRVASDEIINAILDAWARNGQCSLMLTGGNSASSLYSYWKSIGATEPTDPRTKIFFGDERAVPGDHADSNFGMAVRTLFGSRCPQNVERMRGEALDLMAEANRYDVKLPSKINVLLLGVGEDGHIASLFPGSPGLDEVVRRVTVTKSPLHPHTRITITPRVIAEAESLFLLAPGVKKRETLERALSTPRYSRLFPVSLAKHGTWIIDY